MPPNQPPALAGTRGNSSSIETEKLTARTREPERPARLGFAVNVLGRPGLKSADSRRWQNHPHLRTSLGYLKEVFAYLKAHEISMYRMSSQLAPYLTHPDLPQFHRQIDESRTELTEVGRIARDLDLRLSFHPSQFVILNSPDEGLNRSSVLEVKWQVEILDLMGLGPEAVVVIHVGGAYGDPKRSRRRCVRRDAGGQSERSGPAPVAIGSGVVRP